MQRLGQAGAAVDLDLSVVLLLELGHLGTDVAAEDRGRLPARALQCRRDHVLGQGVSPDATGSSLSGKSGQLPAKIS